MNELADEVGPTTNAADQEKAGCESMDPIHNEYEEKESAKVA